jgi:FMN phosphatase YigB (HAD superfamily)
MNRYWLVDFDDTLRMIEAERKRACLREAFMYGIWDHGVRDADTALKNILAKLDQLSGLDFERLGTINEGLFSAGKAIQTLMEQEAGPLIEGSPSSNAYQLIYAHYNQLIEDPANSMAVEGALDFFLKRKNSGDRLSIVTDRHAGTVRKQLENLLKKHGMPPDLFEHVVGAGDENTGNGPLKPKPSRDIYVEALRRMGVDEASLQRQPIEAVVIGDRPAKDIQAANNLRLWLKKQNPESSTVSILLNHRGMSEPHIRATETEPTAIVSTYAELAHTLNQVLTLPEFQVEKLLASSREEFYAELALRFSGETRLLSGEMFESPGVEHSMHPGHDENDLPSAVLLRAGLLPDRNGVLIDKASAHTYKRQDYVELNRGYIAGLAFREIYRGGDEGYAAFTEGQAEAVKLPRKDFDALHEGARKNIDTPEKFMAVLYSVVSVYTSTFNDLGKSKELYALAMRIITGEIGGRGREGLDHDEVIAIMMDKTPHLFTGYMKHMTELQRSYVRKTFNLVFNATSCAQGETTIDHVRDFISTLHAIQDPDERMLVFNIAKIHSIADLAGTQGHKNPYGGATYNKFVHPSFAMVFHELEKAAKGDITADDAYHNIIRANAKKMGFDLRIPGHLAMTRAGMMIRGNSEEDGHLVRAAFALLSPDTRRIIVRELETNPRAGAAPSLWIQYSPDILRILAKEDKRAGADPVNNLAAGFTLLAGAFKPARAFLTANRKAALRKTYMIQGYDLVPVIRQTTAQDQDPSHFDVFLNEGLIFHYPRSSAPGMHVSFRGPIFFEDQIPWFTTPPRISAAWDRFRIALRRNLDL